jgi:hypothetical protein
MDPNALREQLTKLHEELGNAGQVDPASRRLLGEILQDISRLVDAPDVATASDATLGAVAPGATPPGSSLPDRLEQIAVQFEANHPTLAASTRRFVDLLAKAGL